MFTIVAPVLAVSATLLGAVLATPIANMTTRGEATYSGKFTYYNPGSGACGWTSTDSEYVVALAAADFDPYTPGGNPNQNTLCGKYIRIAYNGKTVDVKIVDRCPASSCNSGDIDLSPVGFQALADISLGDTGRHQTGLGLT